MTKITLTPVKMIAMTIIFLSSLMLQFACAQNVPELIYYKFEVPGSTTTNLASSPVGTNPAPVNGLTMGGSGQFGGALLGNGGAGTTNNVTTNWPLNLSGPWTISMWFSGVTNALSSNYFFGDVGGSTFRALTGSGNVAGAGNLEIRGTGLTDVFANGVFDAAGTPVVIHYVYDPTVPDIKVYKNGVFSNAVAQSASMVLTGTNFTVGAYSSNVTLPVGGKMDEFRLYNRALSAAEVSATWNITLPGGPCTDPPTAGTSTATPSTVCAGASVTLNLSGNSSGTGQTYQWQSSSAIGGPYTNVGSSVSSPGITIPVSTSTYYRCLVTCGLTTNISTPVLVNVNPNLPAGTYTINSAVVTGGTNYQTFTAAKNALACGIAGPVIFNVVAGSGPYNEQVSFSPIQNASAVNTVTINGNNRTLTFAATLSTAPSTLELNGTDFMIVNNLNITGTGATYAFACHLWNDANSNAFNNCTFTVPANTISSTCIPFSITGTASTVATGPSGSNNVITGCTMNSGYYNTIFYGNSASPNTGNQLINCNIRDQYYYAVYNLYQNGIIISGNTLERPTRTAVSNLVYYGIYISTGCTNMLVNGNRIRNTWQQAPTSTGTQYSIYDIVAATAGNENKIYNNVISDINYNGTIYGVYGSGASYNKIYHNTISLDQTTASGTTTTYGIYESGTVGVDIRDNIITIRRGGTGTKYCLNFSSTTVASAATCNNNDLYINSAAGTNYVASNTTTNYATLALWQGTGKDANSVSVDPLYVAPGSGDYTPTNGLVNNIGAPVGVLTDINGSARSASTPDPGAYEFSVGGLDAGISWVSPLSPATAGLKTITVNITNTQTTTINSLNLSYNDGTGPVTQSFTGLNIVGGANQNFSFTAQYNLVNSVTMTVSILSVNGGSDGISGNNTAIYPLCVGLSGTYTINSAVATGGTNYQTFTAAVNALGCGIAGPVVFNVNATSGPYTEQVAIPVVGGTSAVNTVTFNGNGRTLTFAATLSTAPNTFELAGADYITVNNLNIAGTGATYAMACHLWNGSDNNTFSNCTFTVPANTISSTCVPFSLSGSQTSPTTAGVSGSNNLITGCTMNSGYYNTVIYGNSVSPFNTGNQVVNCNIRDHYIYGLYNVYCQGTIFSGNTVERLNRTTHSTSYSIYMSTGSINCLADKNRIRKLFDAAPTNTNAAYCMYNGSSGTSGSENKWYNNLVSDISSAGSIYGMYCPLYNFVKIYHNTISFDHVGSTSASSCYGIYAYGSPCDIKNNIVTIRRGGTATKYGLYIPTPAGVTSNNNNIYLNAPAGTNYFGYNGTSSYLTLAAWQAANPTFDIVSTSVDPFFFNPAAGNYKPTSITIDNNGTPVGVTTDITGAVRSPSTPDPGAYEFTVAAKDIGVFNIVSPAPTGCYTSAETFMVTVKNYGTLALNFATDPVTVSCVITGPVNTTVSASLSSGTLAVGATQNVSLSPTVNGTANGTYTINAYTTMASDGEPGNDAFPLTSIPVGTVAGVVASTLNSLCVSGSPVLTASGNYGGAIQWQQSTTSSSGPWTNVGTNSTTYSPGTVTQTTYYQALTVCNTNSSTSNGVTVTVNSPTILSTTPGTHCGNGTVTLGATGSGSTVNWYATPSSFTALGTGSTFTTPSLAATTTYYAAASDGGATYNVGRPSDLTTSDSYNTGTNTVGIQFDALSSFTLNSVLVYPYAATANTSGSITIGLQTSAGVTLQTATINVIGNPTAVGQVVPLNFTVTPGTAYRLLWMTPNTGITGLFREYTATPFNYPYTVPGVVSITSSYTSGATVAYYYYFYNWTVSNGCESSPRTAVNANISTPPLINVVAADPSVCPGGSTTVSVNSLNDPSYSYSWTSNPAGFSGSGAGPLTVSPTITTKYIVTATDNTAGPNAGCVSIDSVIVVTGTALVAGTASVSQNAYCASGTPTLALTGSDGGAIQWQSSTTSASGPWTNVGTLNSTIYNPGTVTQTTYYRAVTSCQSTSVNSNVVTVTINNPQLSSTTPGTHCGAGTVTLGATASAGSTINWYTAATGGTPIGTGNSFTTPVISSPTNYYAAASSGGGIANVGLISTTGFTNGAGTATYGLLFDALSTFALNSVTVYPNSATNGTAGSVVIGLYNHTSGALLQSATFSVTGYIQTSTPTPQIINLNWNITAGTNYRLAPVSFSGISGLMFQPAAGPAPVYPYTLSGVVSITNSTFGGALHPELYYYFYNWSVGSGCEGTRTAVLADITPSTPISVSATFTTPCAGNPSDISVSSANANYTYTWTSNPSGFNQTGPGPFTVTPGVNTSYNVLAFDNSTSCGASGNVNITPTPNTISVATSATPNNFCPGGNAQLNASIATGTTLSYCTTSLTSGNYCNATSGDLTNVTIAGTGFNNNSVCNYNATNGDYTYYPPSATTTAVLMPGQTYSVSVTCNSSAIVSVWFDFNQSGTFEASEWTQVYTTGTTGSVNITIPLSALIGPTGMRVRSRLTANPNGSGDACLSMGSGSTDDYTVTIGNVSPANFTYAWSPANFLSAVNVADPLAQSVPSTQNYTVVVTDQTSGCTKSSTITVTVKVPPSPLASSNSPVCQGSSLTFFGDNLASGQASGNSWSWSGPSFSSTSQNPTLSSATSSNTGTYTLTITNNLGCTATSSITVIVNPNPVLSIATQTNVSCNGELDGQVDIDANNGTPNYLFDLDGQSTLDGMYSGLGAGTYTATVIDDNGCEATALNVTITEPDVLTVSSGSNSPLCTGTALNLTSTPVGGTSGYSYAWTGPNGPVPAVQNPAIPSVTSADAGQYDLTITDAHGCTAGTNHTVSIIAAPTAAISNFGNNNICLSQPATVTLAFTGSGPWNYTVSDGSQTVSGSSSVNPANVNITPVTAGTHSYTVTAVTDANCPAGGTSTGTATVFVSTAPPTNNVGTPAAPLEACIGTVSLITVNSVGGQNIRYSWNTGSNSAVVLYSTNIGGPFSPPPFQTTTNQVYAQFGALAAGSGYNICVQGVNGCGSTNNKCVWIRGKVSVPGTITPSSNAVACPSDIKNYSCGSSGGASVYSWTLSGSSTPITSGQGTTSVQVSFPAAFTSGQLCVTAALACGGSSTSAPRCMTISNNPAIPGTFTAGPNKVCPGSTGITYTVPSVTGAAGYSWTVPVGSTITSGANTNSIQVNFPASFAGSSQVCVSATSACGASVARCKTVSSGIPNQPGSVTGPTTNICNSTVQYSISNVAGASGYNWINPAGTTITSGQGSTTILLSVGSTFNTGQLTVTANTSLCTPGTSIPRTITINGKPNVPASISANPTSWCNNDFVNFSAPIVTPAVNYNWAVTQGTITAGQGSNNIDVTWGTGTGNVTVNATNTCGASSNRVQSFTGLVCREEGIASENALSVYPNPAHDKVTVSFYVNEAVQFNLQLRDMSGRVILSEDHDGSAGLNTYDVELKNFAKGIYTLEVQPGSESWKTKVVIE